MSIYSLFRDRDYTALASAVHKRWGLKALDAEFDCLHKLAFQSDPPLAGGTGDSPWSDETWLLWLRNRLEELSDKSCTELLAKAGIEWSPAIVDAPAAGERLLMGEGTFEGCEAEVLTVDEAAKLATVHVLIGFSACRMKVPLSSLRRSPGSG